MAVNEIIDLLKEKALAIQCAERILLQDSTTAKWIAREGLRELTSLKPSRKKGL
jgi:hypothetical protein